MIPKLNGRQQELLYFFNRLSRQRDYMGETKPVPKALKLHEIRAELPYTTYNPEWFVWCIEQIDMQWLNDKYDEIRRRNGN
jgi:hypothetical protein